MRQIFLFLSISLFPFFSIAQQRSSSAAPDLEQRVSALPAGDFRAVNDTLQPPIFGDTCASTVLTYISNANWGFVSGTNGYSDKEKAQRLDYSTTANVDILEVWAFFSVAKAVGDGIVKFKLYDVDAGSGPGNLLGETTSSRVSGLGVSDTAVIATIFPVLGQVSVSGQSAYFASLDISGIYATDDTVSLFSTKEGCGDATSSWEKFSDDSWVNVSSQDSWQLTLDFYIASIISFDETSSIGDGFATEGLTIHPAFPNPASDELTLSFELNQPQHVTVEVYDLSGRRISASERGVLPSGDHKHELGIQSLSAGIYTYVIRTDNTIIGEKFQVK